MILPKRAEAAIFSLAARLRHEKPPLSGLARRVLPPSSSCRSGMSMGFAVSRIRCAVTSASQQTSGDGWSGTTLDDVHTHQSTGRGNSSSPSSSQTNAARWPSRNTWDPDPAARSRNGISSSRCPRSIRSMACETRQQRWRRAAKSGCARWRGAVLGARRDRIAWTR